MSTISDTTSELNKFTYYFSISSGLFIFSIGIIGNILNIIIFTSLQTFRKNPCAFCLLILSISDSGFLLFGSLSNTLRDLLQQSSNLNALFFCKTSISFAQIFGLFSHSILCLTIIDQYLSTSKIKHQNRITLKHIRWLIIILFGLCTLHGFPFFIYYEEQIIPGTNVTLCRLFDSNGIFSKHLLYFGFPFVLILLPILIMSIFALLSLKNIRSMTKRHVPIIHLRIEQQIISMVLTKILNVFISVIPYLISYLIRNIISPKTNNIFIQQQLIIVSRFFNFLLYVNYANSCYIFLVISARFRRQFKFVLFDIYFKRWQQKRNVNQIKPVSEFIFLSISRANTES